jgi:hypothetical protein
MALWGQPPDFNGQIWYELSNYARLSCTDSDDVIKHMIMSVLAGQKLDDWRWWNFFGSHDVIINNTCPASIPLFRYRHKGVNPCFV